MPHYYDLLPGSEIIECGHPRYVDKILTDTEKKRTLHKILQIKTHFSTMQIPDKRGNNLLLCNWNLKEFGQSQKHPEFYYYIAEMMNAFDLIVIQEVRRSIRELLILLNILGSDWSYVINDVTEGSDGNGERSAVLYNTKRVDFSGFSGELVVDVKVGDQLKRTPHVTGFLAAWKHFSIINVHLDPGKKTKNAAHRKNELSHIMETLKPKLKTGGLGYGNIIISGDFNFYPDIDDESIDLLRQHKFEQVEKVSNADTTLAQNNHTYDRMFIRRDEYFEIVKDEAGVENAGVFEFKSLFTDNLNTYKAMAKQDYKKRNPNKTLDDSRYPNYFWVHWLSRQMSDHYPLWIEINTDSSRQYLQSKLQEF